MKLSMIYGGIIMSTTIYLIRHSKPLKVNNNLKTGEIEIIVDNLDLINSSK